MLWRAGVDAEKDPISRYHPQNRKETFLVDDLDRERFIDHVGQVVLEMGMKI